MKYFKILLIIFIIAFIVGYIPCRIISFFIYKDTHTEIILTCTTKDDKEVTIDTLLEFKNFKKYPKSITEPVIIKSCNYVFQFYTLDEVKTSYHEITALITELIFNELQDKDFKIYNFTYKIL